MIPAGFHLQIPSWIAEVLPSPHTSFASPEERMRLVIDLARRNVAQGTGGPFAAGIFDMDDGRLVAPGVNLVLSARTSVAHAEMVAILLAQHRAGDWDLGRSGRRLQLVASTEPCAMCYGAVPWSGVRALVCGARGEDACRIGFDEGEKPQDWVGALERRGIEVIRDVLREEAAGVLGEYIAAGGLLYNAGGQASPPAEI